MHVRTWALSFSLLAACGGGAADAHGTGGADGTYAIQLARHVPVGFSWGEVTHFASQQRTLVHVGEAIAEDSTVSTTIEMGGDYTVVSVRPTGEVGSLRFTVDHLTVDSGQGAISPTVPAVLIIERGEPGTITSEGGEAIEPALLALLRDVTPVRSPPDEADDDTVFGTSVAQSVSASWPIDSAGAAHSLAALGLQVAPSNVGGSTTLVSVGNEAGHDILQLRTMIRASHIGLPGLPPGSVEQHADVEAILDVALPRDLTLPPLHETTRSTVDIQVAITTPSGPGMVDVDIREEESHARTFR